jgi:hypothetical protein
MDALPGVANVRPVTMLAAADLAPITAGTVNYHLLALSGWVAGKWFDGTELDWSDTEAVAAAGTHKARGRWTASIDAVAWEDGLIYFLYAEDEAGLAIPWNENIYCRSPWAVPNPWDNDRGWVLPAGTLPVWSGITTALDDEDDMWIELSVSASAADDAYNGMLVFMYDFVLGRYKALACEDYAGSSRRVTLDAEFGGYMLVGYPVFLYDAEALPRAAMAAQGYTAARALRLDSIGAASVTWQSPVTPSGRIGIIRGDTYTGERALAFTKTAWVGPDLDGLPAVLRLAPAEQWRLGSAAAVLEAPCTLAQTGTTVSVNVELSAAQTALLVGGQNAAQGEWRYAIVCEIASGASAGTYTVWAGPALIEAGIGEAP